MEFYQSLRSVPLQFLGIWHGTPGMQDWFYQFSIDSPPFIENCAVLHLFELDTVALGQGRFNGGDYLAGHNPHSFSSDSDFF